MRKILSASYRTDIPALYAGWFLERLRAGYAFVRNPYSGKLERVDLTPEAISGIVFWTRNAQPLLPHLSWIRERYPLYFQFTVTGYPRRLELRVPPPEYTIPQFKRIIEIAGPGSAVWRYDPVLFSELTPPQFHRENFRRLADSLEGLVDEVVVSFAAFYSKTKRNLAKAGIEAWDPPSAQKREFLEELAEMAAGRGISLRVCGQRHLETPRVPGARCIDPKRLSRLAGYEITAPPKPHRPCGCADSVDIGAYDTCTLGCIYCYAVSSPQAALRRRRSKVWLDREWL